MRTARSAALLSDQVAYSLGNFLLQLVVLRVATPPELAAFALSYSILWLVTGSARAMFGESQLAVRARLPGRNATAPFRYVVLYSAGGALLALVGAQLVDEAYRSVAQAMAVATAVLAIADFVRYSYLRVDDSRSLLRLDVVWLVVQSAVFLLLLWQGVSETWTYVFAWAATGLLACLPGLRRVRQLNASEDAWSFFVGRGMAGEFFITSGVQQALPALLLVTGYVLPLAALRAAQTLLSPLNTLFTAGTTLAYSRAGPAVAPRRLGQGVALVLVAVVVTYGAALLLMPRGAVAAVLGETSLLGLDLMVPMTAHMVTVAAMTGAILVNRLLRPAKETFTLRALTAPMLLVGPVVGVYFGATGLAWGVFAGSTLAAVVWWAAAYRTKGTT